MKKSPGGMAKERKRVIKQRHPQPKIKRLAESPSVVSYLPDHQKLSLSESGCLTWGPMGKYVVPEKLLQRGNERKVATKTPTRPSGSSNSDLANTAFDLIDHCEPAITEVIRALGHIRWETSPSELDRWEVKAFLTESRIAALAAELIAYMGARASSGSTEAIERLINLAENCIDQLDKAPTPVLSDVAKRRATYPVKFGRLPEHREAAEERVVSLKIGREAPVRAWVHEHGRPFSLTTPINELAASLISYIREVRVRKPAFADTPITHVAELPEELLSQIFALPELEESPSGWAKVSILLILNSGLNLRDIPAIRSLGVHRKESHRSEKNPARAEATSLEDGIRTALKQSFATLARRPKEQEPRQIKTPPLKRKTRKP